MSQARNDLLNRLQNFSDCLQEPALTNGTPTDTKRNATATLLRSGLAVLQFATVEAFIKDRTCEILNSFSANAVSFSDFSQKLQLAVTTSALQGVLFQSKLQEKNIQASWVLNALPSITNAATNVSALSRYSFGYASSNISSETVKDILLAFGVDGGWQAITEVAKIVGAGGAPDYAQVFNDLADRRHSSAHDISSNVPFNDLADSIKSILGLCCAFDILVSHSLSRYNRSNAPNSTNGLVRHSDLKFRFISPHPLKPGHFREQLRKSVNNNNMTTVKVHASLSSAKTSALTRSKEHLIILSSNGLPSQWSSW